MLSCSSAVALVRTAAIAATIAPIAGIAAVTVVAAAALVACTSPTQSDALVIWDTYNSEEHGAFREIVALYEKSAKPAGDPPVVVHQVPFDRERQLPKIIMAAIANETPDICRVDIGRIARLAYGGVAENLETLGPRDDWRELLPIAVDSNIVTVSDPATGQRTAGLFGISDQLTCVALYYNKDLFAAAGIARPPATLPELLDVARRLTDPSQGRYGLGLNNTLWWHLPFLYAFGADVVAADNSRSRLREPGAIAAFRFLRQLYAEGAEAGAWRAGAITPEQGFINGKYAMVVDGPWHLQTFKSVNYGVSLFPGQGGTEGATNIGGTSMIVLANSKKKKAAYAFLKFLTSFTAQSLWAEKTSQMSVNGRVNADRAARLTPAMQTFAEQLRYAKPRPRLPNYDQLENLVNPVFYSVLDGKVTPEEGLAEAARLTDEKVLAVLSE